MADAPLPSFRLDGRRALVTGSTQGIGLALARAFVHAGASVCLHGLGGGLELERERQALSKIGPKVGFCAADLARTDDVRLLLESVESLLGGVDILVLNAAVQVEKRLEHQSDAEIEWQLDVNLRSAFQLLRALLEPMKARGWGRVLSIGSIQEFKGSSSMPVYGATKAAQVNWVSSLARRYARHGVTINSLAPGVVDTPRNDAMLRDHFDKVQGLVPMKRVGQPEDLIGPALLLCSDAGHYITGISLPVDGGMSAGR